MPKAKFNITPQHLWERQPDETSPAYEAFTVYLLMHNRSLREVALKLGKSKVLIERWSSKHEWQKRIAAFENQAASRAAETATQLEVDWKTEKERIRVDALRLGFTVQKRVEELLKLPLIERRNEGAPIQTADGQTIYPVTIFKPQTNRDPTLMLKYAIEIQRMAADMPTSNIKITANKNIDEMTDEELDAHIAELEEQQRAAVNSKD